VPRCERERPPLLAVAPGHSTACFVATGTAGAASAAGAAGAAGVAGAAGTAGTAGGDASLAEGAPRSAGEAVGA
jgi:hypothetical protein